MLYRVLHATDKSKLYHITNPIPHPTNMSNDLMQYDAVTSQHQGQDLI